MKKAFLFLTMLLFAFMGTMRADEVTVCDGTATNDYVPVYGLYADTQGCQSEFVIPASEIGILPGGQISKLTFYLSTPATAAWTATFQVYMTEIEGTTLSAFVGPSGCTQVYQGALNGTGSTMEVVFDNDYTYNGGNLLIGTFVSTAGNYKSAKFYGVTAAGASIQRNSSTGSPNQRNFLPKTTFEFVQGDLPATTIVPSENPVQLGVRPIGAWMKPYELAITNQGTPTTVTGVDGTANFAVEAEVPYALGYNGTMPISVTTTGTPAAGTLNGQVLVSYSDRTFTTIDATAEMYEPVDGDVWEMAEEVTAMPFQGNAPTGIYRNYELGQADDAADAVYKVTFDNDVLFSAGTNGAGAKTRLYTEDFNGVGGPDADNNYVYNGPTVNPGPMQMWFAYAYSGTNTWYGLSAGGGYYFGYKIPASYIEELGLAGTSITTVEAAARESYDYECYVIKGGATPFDGELVSFGVAENPQALYFFDINLEEPVLVNEGEDIWVIFYSDSPYASYCGRVPVDATNGKIWTYNPNATSPAWSSNTAYTPVIYTRFLELPTGREVTVDLGSMKIKEGNGVASEIAAVDGTAMGVSKAQMYNEAKAQNTRGNRDTQTLIEEGWEDGIGDWTMNNCESGTGVYTGAANNGSNCFRFKWTTNTPQYLISPELTDNNGGTMSFYCRAYTYTESYRIGYSTTTDDIGAFTFGDEVTVTSQLYAEHTATFPAGTKYVAIASTAYDAYYFLVDDITITADVTSGGGSTDPVYQIADMYVPAGTYYVAVASKTENFQVDMMTTEVPAPEQAVVVSPYDGETNVSDPYLAEWVLGNYTEEMQVLVGTQYPPQTALIDWTDYLVESAFLMDLEPNQSYFLQVNERNAAGTTMGEIIAFTTPIDPVEEVVVTNPALYPGDAAMLTWTANARTLKGYNVYVDGVKYNESLITTNAYNVEGLEYNMAGYDIQVSAVYDAGESELSEAVTAYMTGYGSVSGHAYDKPDEDTDAMPIAFATVMFNGSDEYGVNQTFVVETDEEGAFAGEILAGTYTASVITEGYDSNIAVNALVIYNNLTDNIDIYTHEFYYPVGQVTATEEEDDVLVEWSWDPAEMIVDFETGDFSQAEFTLPAQYPWTITTVNPYEGTYCMKSTCEGQASASSIIEATVEVPFEEAKMGFWVRTSSEANYDKFHFYIDGVEKGQALSGQNPYAYKEFAVEGGIHTYKWEYTKDSSVNGNDDCIYVDNICMYRKDEPIPPTPGATTYTFDDSTMEGWTTIDANNDGYDWVLGSEVGGVYLASGASLAGSGHDESADMVCSGSYSNATSSAITPDNYLVAPAQINVQAGALISFYACAQDASYAAEHFGVAVSTTTATASAFTMVQEWTMTAKSAPTAENHGAIRGTRAQGSWYNYSVDLSSYAGQTIWVAIRHFNCNDQFILNVDDITIYDGSAKMAPRNDRSFQSFNVYRRNNIDSASVAEPEVLATGVSEFEYTDAEWATLPYGEYQWGIAATYDGYAPTERSRETATFGFEGGLEGWTGIVVNTDGGEWIHSDDNLGGYDYTALAHTGTGFAMCYSYVDYVGAYDTDAYLVSPQKYSVDANSSITFWADNANDSYPENFSVCVSTAANPTASDFTQVWSGGAKGTGNGGAAVRRSDNRYENWRSHEVSLAAYAGQEIWIAFHDVNYDMYEIWIDDVTITYAGSAPVPPTPGPTGSGISEILWSNMIEKDMEATLTFDINLNNGQSAEGAAITVVGASNEYEAEADEEGLAEIVVRKGDTYDITVALEGYTAWNPQNNPVLVEDDIEYEILLNEIVAPAEDFYVSPTGWAMWEGATGGVTPTPPTPPTGILFEDDFEDGALTNWTTVDADGDGDTWQNATPAAYSIGDAHSGTNCASSWSWNSVTMYPDNWMISPMVEGATSIQYYVATNTAYPDHYGIYASSTGTSTSDFTLVFEETAGSKGGNGVKSSMTQGSSREMSAWIEKNIELPAGTKYVAFRHWNSDDMNYLFIDDVTIEGAGRGDRAPLSYKMMLDGEYVGETYYPFYQFDVEGMEEGETHIGGVAPLYASGMGDWTYYTWTYKPCENFDDVTEFTSTVNEQTVTLNWTLPGGQPVPPTPGEGQWYYYDNGVNDNNIGASGQFYWAVMFPAGQYTGDYVTKVATYDSGNAGYAFTGTATIYQGGTTAPGTAVGTVNVATTGATPGFVEYEFAEPVNIDDSQNLWVVFYNETSSSYCAAAYMESGAGDVNARWVSLDGSSWMDLATAGISGYGWMLRVYVAEGAKGEVHEISVPTQSCNNAGVLSAMPVRNNRDMWDLVGSFTGTSAGQQGVATDGQYIYTVSWQPVPTGGHTFYQYDLQGNFIEGFEIAGATQIRDLTSDGEYFYGTSGGTQIYCMDFNTRTLVGTINCSGLTSRHISYDPERDGFWSGNWSTLALYSRTGALIQNGPAPTSAYGSAYYKDADGVEHLFLFCQPNSDCKVYDYNITTGTLGTDVVLDFSSTAPGCTGIAGGCFIGTYAGKTCWFGNSQQDPNLIAIYELDAEGPVPPQPVEGVIGAILYRDGEFVDMFDANTTTYTETLEPGDYTYTIRVIYDGEPDVTYWAMSCGTDEDVTIEPLSIAENDVISSIYPNPTSGDLHINAVAMRNVTVINAMGQVVYNQDVDADEMVLNMSQLESGVYMVKVETETGSSVKRITVVK